MSTEEEVLKRLAEEYDKSVKNARNGDKLSKISDCSLEGLLLQDRVWSNLANDWDDNTVDLFEEKMKKLIKSIVREKGQEWLKERVFRRIQSKRPLLLRYKTKVDLGFESGDQEVLYIKYDETEEDPYKCIGGKFVIHAITKKAYYLMGRDVQLKSFYENVDTSRLSDALGRFLAMKLLEEEDLDMIERMQAAHTKLKLTTHHFELFKAHLDGSMEYYEVPVGLRALVLTLINDSKPQILDHIPLVSGESSFVTKAGTSLESLNIDAILDKLDELELIKRIGGIEVLQVVVSNFLRSVADDSYLLAFFSNVDLKRHHNMLVRFLTLALQSQSIPKAILKQMQKAHSNLGLDNEDYDKVVSLFRKAFSMLTLMTPEMLKEIEDKLELLRKYVIG